MKNNWKKILNELSYRVSSGIPDLTNEQHLMKLWDILKEEKWPIDVRVELLNNLTNSNDKVQINEVSTKRTEDLHEAFFAVAFAGGKLSSVKNFSELEKLIRKLSMLDNKPAHIKTFKEWNSKDPLFTPKDIELYTDATQLAKKAHQYLTVNKMSPSKVSKVFGAGASGKKVIADAVVTLSTGDIVAISLKFKKAQFNSLSIPMLVEKLWGIKLSKSGLLNDMYKAGYKSDIDNAIHYYFMATYDYRDLPVDKKYTEKDRETLMNLKGFSNKSTWSDYLKLPVDTRRAFSHLYSHPGVSQAKKVYQSQKGMLINNAIDSYLGVDKKFVDNLEEALIYILRAEPETNYLYMAEGGKKFALIPSAKQIRGKQYTFKDNVKTNDNGVIDSADYQYDMDVFVDGIKAFTFDIKWRFAGKGGQWSTDLNHKGSKIIFHSGFAKAFGLPNFPKEM